MNRVKHPLNKRHKSHRAPLEQPVTLSNRFVIAVDYGTTFTSVAFIVVVPGEDPKTILTTERIHLLGNFSNDPRTDGVMRTAVPTESWYPENSDFRKKGISNGASGKAARQSRRRIISDDDDDDIDDDLMDDLEDGKELTDDLFRWGYDATLHAKDRGIRSGATPASSLQHASSSANGSSTPADSRNTWQHITKAKLLLDDSEHTQQVREEGKAKVAELKARKLIPQEDASSEERLIADFLTSLLRHAKSEIEKPPHNYSDQCVVEFVCSVPVVWSRGALRSMGKAIAIAIEAAGFTGIVEEGSVNNLFLVSEPEAAAAYFLAKPELSKVIKPGETFVLLDAGGGTVDAVTYRVDRTAPLRLEREEVEPAGALCGSSYLNVAFEELLEKSLRKSPDSGFSDEKIRSAVAAAVHDFEHVHKRRVDTINGTNCNVPLVFPGLGDKILNMRKPHFERVFLPQLQGVESVMMQQLDNALALKRPIHHVILMGGFGESLSLRAYLDSRITELNTRLGSNVKFRFTEAPGNAVASGAVLRALNKEDGPTKTAYSSYGFLRDEPFDRAHAGHREQQARKERGDENFIVEKGFDGLKWVEATLDWKIQKGAEQRPIHVYEETSIHVFDTRDEIGACEEVLYRSDSNSESHYPLQSAKNRGARVERMIQVGRDTLEQHDCISRVGATRKAKAHWQVEYQVFIILTGVDLQFLIKKDHVVMAKAVLNVAADFALGAH